MHMRCLAASYCLVFEIKVRQSNTRITFDAIISFLSYLSDIEIRRIIFKSDSVCQILNKNLKSSIYST